MKSKTKPMEVPVDDQLYAAIYSLSESYVKSKEEGGSIDPFLDDIVIHDCDREVSRKLEAYKTFSEVTGISLGDAKYLIETRLEENGEPIVLPTWGYKMKDKLEEYFELEIVP